MNQTGFGLFRPLPKRLLAQVERGQRLTHTLRFSNEATPTVFESLGPEAQAVPAETRTPITSPLKSRCSVSSEAPRCMSRSQLHPRFSWNIDNVCVSERLRTRVAGGWARESRVLA